MANPLVLLGAAALTVLACRAPRPPVAAVDPVPKQAVAPHTLPLGSRDNPVRARGPFGEREYIRRLRCPGGEAPTVLVRGSVGGGADDHIIDAYRVTCAGGRDTTPIYMDMYHQDVRERRPVPGFTVLAELPARTATGCPPNVGPTADSRARYVFDFLEVETPARLQNRPTGPIAAGFTGYVTVSFVVDTLGRVEPASLQMGNHVEERVRDAARPIVLALRFTPAEHRPGCRVRQGTGLSLQFR